MSPKTLTFNNAARRPGRGWFWIVAAAGILLASLVVPALPSIEAGAWWRYIPRILAGIPLLIGIGVLTIRQGVRIDDENKAIEDWHGFVPFVRTRTVAFNDIRDVRIGKVVLPSRYGPPHVIHAVMLKGPQPHVLISSGADYADARATAEHLAAVLDKPLRDEALEPIYREDGTAIETRDPRALDASLQQQAAASRKSQSFPMRPADCRIRAHRAPNQYIFELPVLRRSLAPALCVAAFSLGLAAVLAFVVRGNMQPEDPAPARAMLWSLPAAVALIGPAFALGRGLNRGAQNERITITPLALRREVGQRWTRRAVELPIEAIEEFGYTPMAAAWARSSDAGRRSNQSMKNAAISARTDFKRVYLGQGLRRSEQVWLHDALKYVLAQAASGRESAPGAGRKGR